MLQKHLLFAFVFGCMQGSQLMQKCLVRILTHNLLENIRKIHGAMSNVMDEAMPQTLNLKRFRAQVNVDRYGLM